MEGTSSEGVGRLVELTRRLREIGQGSSPTEVAQAAVRAARWALRTDISWCGFRHGDALVMGAYENLHPSMADVWRLPVSEGIGGRVAATGRTLRANDYLHDPRRVPVLKSLIDDAGVRGCICAPLTGEGVVFGVLYVADRRPRAFSDQEAELATLIAEHAGDTLSRLDREAMVDTEAAALQREIEQSRAAREDLMEVADALADANDVVAGLRFLASRLGVEVRLHDQFGNLLRKAGDVLGDVQLRVPLTADPSDLGELEVIADAPLQKAAAELVQQTARLIVLQILRERSGLEAELQLHSEFFSGLLAGTLDGDDEGLLRRASLLGLDLREPMAVVCIGVHEGTAQPGGARKPPTRLIRQAVERAAREQFRRPVVSLRAEEIVVVAEVGERDHAALHEHVAALVQRASRTRGTELSAGIGRICTALSDYPESYYQATMALSLAVRRPAPRAVVTPADLGLYGLFGHGASRQSLQSIVDQALGPLIEADARTASEHIKTLDAFLANDRHLERAAKSLHVHVNTVRYRLNRIQEISAIDLHDVESRFLVELALRARAALPEVGDQSAAPAPESSTTG